ncbi:hypothetical protein D3C81_1444760 [compost metagenome]
MFICWVSTSAPTLVAGSSGLPGFQAFSASITSGRNLSLIERSTSRREPAVQTSPWLKAMAPAAASAASCRFGASANTMFGLLPPASSQTRFMFDSPE